jgi:hypothetical protein
LKGLGEQKVKKLSFLNGLDNREPFVGGVEELFLV